MIKYIYILAALVVVSCSKDTNSVDDREPISFSHSITKGVMLQPYHQAPSVSTIAYQNDVEHIPMQELKQNSLSKNWEYITTQYWPSDGSSLRFDAYSPTASSDNGLTLLSSPASIVVPEIGELVLPVNGTLYMEYNVPSDVTKQPDLMFAHTVGSKTSTDHALMFQHALAAIGFKVSGSQNKRVKDIKITGAQTKGNVLYFTKPSSSGPSSGFVGWIPEASPERTDLVAQIQNDIVPSASGSLLVDYDEFLMMIPQELDGSIAPKLVATITDIDGSNEQVVELALSNYSTWWQSGKFYIYEINIHQEVTISLSIKEWNDGGEGELGDYYAR